MTKTRSTKRALLLSALSLLMCVSMLIGSTFAWFTDSVTSGNNKIVAGTLDVDLLMADATGNYDSIADKDAAIFGEGSLAQNNAQETLWEPGKTQIVYLAVENKGNLDLKYNIALNVVDGGLIGSLEYAIVDGAKYGDIEATSWTELKADAQTGDVVAGTIVAAPNGAITVAEKTEYFALAVHMKEEAGNQYQGKDITIDVTVLATQLASESDSFNNQYDKDAKFYDVASAEELQEAIYNAVPGTTIQLAPGVNYGTLVFGQNAGSKVVDINDIGGDAAGNEHYSRYENITILGAAGATIDQIDFEVGWLGLPEGASYVDIKNLTVKGVTFSGEKTAFNMESSKASNLGIDGLNIVGCKMNDADGNNRFVYQQITGYKVRNDKTTNEYVMTIGVKNLTITGCEITGAYQVIEGRPMENITITDNIFNGIKARDILLSSVAPTLYTGTITITGNTSNGSTERFIRGSGIGDATLIIKDNTVNNYMGEDDDYIKVEGATGTKEVSGNVATPADASRTLTIVY